MLMNDGIDKNDPVPIYHQIAQKIRQHIVQNNLDNGDAIPSEREFCEAFEVSRMTVRQAVSLLVQEGMLVRQKGKGTFVITPKLSQPLSSLTSFTMDTISRGMTPTSDVLSCESVLAPYDVAEQLGLGAGEKVIRLVRVRLANGKPHAYECSYLLHDMAETILNTNLVNRSLYAILREQCGMKLVKAKEMIEVMECPEEICTVLNIPRQSLSFHMLRLTYDPDDKPVEYVESYYRVDKFKFEVELQLE